MTRYMIHAVPQRMWYVEDYLIPSMLKQGIEKDCIQIHNDTEHTGNLRACMEAFAEVQGDGGTWHLQDDVCICSDFKHRTEALDFGLVCGFSSKMYDGPGREGAINIKDMWFSFPCIRIPNDYARECSAWVLNYIIGNPVYRQFWKDGVNDDWAFRTYLRQFHKGEHAINLSPNLVDHVDWLIGGGTGHSKRNEPVRAQYWKDEYLITELEKEIKANQRGR